MKEYEGYLFDLDGTLIDTTELIERCFERSLAKAGITEQRERLLAYVGMPLREQFEALLGPTVAARVDLEELMRFHMDYQVSIWRDHVRLYPGVEKVLCSLRDRQKKMAIVTSRRLPTTHLYMKELGLLPFFELVVTPEATSHHKPHPEPLLKAVEGLCIQRETCLFIGDSHFDMLAAASAVMDSYFVSWGFGMESSLKAEPTYVQPNLSLLIDCD